MLELLNINDFNKVFAIMEDSFPIDEYRPYEEQKKILDELEQLRSQNKSLESENKRLANQRENLKSQVSDLNNALSAYETNLQSDLSGWSGLAQNEFTSFSEQQIANARKYVTSIDELANFLNNAVNVIETAETEISAISI